MNHDDRGSLQRLAFWFRLCNGIIAVVACVGLVAAITVGSVCSSIGCAVAMVLAASVAVSFEVRVRFSDGTRWSSTDEATVRRFRRKLNRHLPH